MTLLLDPLPHIFFHRTRSVSSAATSLLVPHVQKPDTGKSKKTSSAPSVVLWRLTSSYTTIRTGLMLQITPTYTWVFSYSVKEMTRFRHPFLAAEWTSTGIDWRWRSIGVNTAEVPQRSEFKYCSYFHIIGFVAASRTHLAHIFATRHCHRLSDLPGPLAEPGRIGHCAVVLPLSSFREFPIRWKLLFARSISWASVCAFMTFRPIHLMQTLRINQQRPVTGVQ